MFYIIVVPGYHSKHQVIVAPWSYAADQQEQQLQEEEEAKTEENNPEEEQPALVKTLDLSHPLPSYQDIQEEKSTSSEKQVGIIYPLFAWNTKKKRSKEIRQKFDHSVTIGSFYCDKLIK